MTITNKDECGSDEESIEFTEILALDFCYGQAAAGDLRVNFNSDNFMFECRDDSDEYEVMFYADSDCTTEAETERPTPAPWTVRPTESPQVSTPPCIEYSGCAPTAAPVVSSSDATLAAF